MFDTDDMFQTKNDADNLPLSASLRTDQYASLLNNITSPPQQMGQTSRISKNSHMNQEDILPVIKSLCENVLKRDEHDVFGEHIANKLRNCRKSWQEKAIAQHKINNILFQLEMGLFSQEINNYSCSQSNERRTEPVTNSQDTSQYSPQHSNNSLDEMSSEQIFCDITIKNEMD